MTISDAQRKKLCEMMYYAFLEVRLLGSRGESEQAAALADAFHHLPKGMWKKHFNLEDFRDSFLAAYQKDYPNQGTRDYVKMIERIIEMESEDHSSN